MLFKDICRATRKCHSSEQKIRIVLDGLRGKDSIAEFRRREGIAQSLYCSWWKEFLETGKKLENYCLLGHLEAQIEAFVEHYNYRCYHESPSNVTPADVYLGRGQTGLLKRDRIKQKTMEQRRLQHRKKSAQYEQKDEPEPPMIQTLNRPNIFDDGKCTANKSTGLCG